MKSRKFLVVALFAALVAGGLGYYDYNRQNQKMIGIEQRIAFAASLVREGKDDRAAQLLQIASDDLLSFGSHRWVGDRWEDALEILEQIQARTGNS